ncbi:MAG: hypothetical protein V2B19_09010 [Pseudomonadota bacterium]
MDNGQIDRMQPGRELNILVAKEVMGTKVVTDEIFGLMEMIITDKGENVFITLRAYSEDMSFARRVIARMIELDFHDETAYWQAEDRPEIICKAALRAVLRRKKKVAAAELRSRLRVVK